jgi:hypothetical protein
MTSMAHDRGLPGADRGLQALIAGWPGADRGWPGGAQIADHELAWPALMADRELALALITWLGDAGR